MLLKVNLYELLMDPLQFSQANKTSSLFEHADCFSCTGWTSNRTPFSTKMHSKTECKLLLLWQNKKQIYISKVDVPDLFFFSQHKKKFILYIMHNNNNKDPCVCSVHCSSTLMNSSETRVDIVGYFLLFCFTFHLKLL